METLKAAPVSSAPSIPAGSVELAAAARGVADELESTAGSLETIRQRLSESLRCPLSSVESGRIVAEVAALAWVEADGAALSLPGPLQPVEVLLERPATSGLETALELLRRVAVQLRQARDLDPALYETFLGEFDPQARARHSVYFTPPPLVRMLVRSVEHLLEEQLGLASGLASPEVGLLDPAAGAGTFLLEALRHARLKDHPPAGPRAAWHAFELQPGAYVAARLRLGRLLTKLSDAPRLPPVDLKLCDLLGPDSPLAGRGNCRWGTPKPSALVVLGNPPWSGTDSSSPWVEQLLETGYERPDGTRDHGYYRGTGSRNTKWLRSRYVKFLRLAQWSVDQVGRGVVALVLSDGIAENLTMVGLRESLLGSFEAIYLLDLGGSARKVGSEGQDANLFGVQQGACVLFLIKGGTRRGVRSFELRGLLQDKLAWIETQSVATIPWAHLQPRPPLFAFRAHTAKARGCSGLYWSAPSVREVFERGSTAVITGRDPLVVGFDERELLARIGLLREGRDASLFGLKRSGGFDPDEAIGALVADEDWQQCVVPYLLRPGDRRVLFAAPYLTSRPRRAVMAEIERPGNLALLLPRRRRAFPSVWVTDCTASHRVAAAYEGSYAFPLYVGADRRPNFSPTVLDDLQSRYGDVPAAEEIFGFLYAQLWSRSYHERYCEELRQDWPRLLCPRSVERFSMLAGAGWKLVQIHLGSNHATGTTWFHGELPVRLPRRLGKSFEHEPDGRLRLGLRGEYLAPVSPEVMAFKLGGYRLVSGWLRRRSGRELAARNIEELSELVEAIEATRCWQDELAGLEDSNGT